MASLFSCFCMGKRWKEITIKSKDIDGGTIKESPSKLKPIIRAEAAANNNSKSIVGSEPFKVKHRKKRSSSLVTDGGAVTKNDCFKRQTFDLRGKGGGGGSNDTRSGKDYKEAKTPKKSLYRRSVGELLGDHGEIDFATTKPPQPLVVRKKCKRLLHRSHSPVNESSLKNELFKIKTFDLRAGDGGSTGSNGVDTCGGAGGGQGGGAGGVAK